MNGSGKTCFQNGESTHRSVIADVRRSCNDQFPMQSHTAMNCPQCDEPMEQGELDLKAWGIGLAPQAQLHFGRDLLLKDQYFPVTGFFRKGTAVTGYRCKACQLVCFRYAADDRG